MEGEDDGFEWVEGLAEQAAVQSAVRTVGMESWK